MDSELLPLCRAKGVGVIVWSPLAGGWLTGKYRGDVPEDARLNEPGRPPMGATVDREQILDTLINVAQGLNATPGQVALRWVMDQEGVTSAIIGARNAEQLDSNLGAADLKMDHDAWKALDRASRLPLTYPSGLILMMQRRRQAQLAQAEA